MNPWHDIKLGVGIPDVYPAVVEIPKGSKNKYELDKDTGLIPKHRLSELKRFFEDYKILENKSVVVEKFLGTKYAEEALQEAIENYRKKFGS